MSIRFTPSARSQFRYALSRLRRDGPAGAAGFLRRVASVLEKLGPEAKKGNVIPEFPELPFREIVIGPYRFFYRSQGRTTWIAGVWRSARAEKAEDA